MSTRHRIFGAPVFFTRCAIVATVLVALALTNIVIAPAVGAADDTVGGPHSHHPPIATPSEALPPIPPECPRGSWRQIGGRKVLGMIYTGTCIRFSYKNIGCKWCTCHYIAYFNGRHWTWSDAHDDCGLDLPIGISV